MQIISYIAVLAGGYVASIYTWPAVRTALTGAQTEINKLKDRAKAIEAKIRGL